MDLLKYRQTGVLDLDQDDLNDPGTMLVVQRLMDAEQDAFYDECDLVQTQFGVTADYARAIVYLRTRSRWTEELEQKLVQMSKDGEPCPNMCEWPPEVDD